MSDTRYNCPTCAAKSWAVCKCPSGFVRCENDHYWTRCAVHEDEKVIVSKEEATAHPHPEKTDACMCSKKRKADEVKLEEPRKKKKARRDSTPRNARVDAAFKSIALLTDDDLGAIEGAMLRTLFTSLRNGLQK